MKPSESDPVRRPRLRGTRALGVAVTATLVVGVTSAFAVAPATAAAPASPTEASADEWTALQAQLADVTGTWTTQDYAGALTTGMPDTALLGNGDVGAVSGGGTGYKTFYVTKGDFWSGNGGVAPAGLGSVSIKPVTPDEASADLALGATATASSVLEDHTPAKAVNGAWGQGYEGWVSNVGKPQWMALDLGSAKEIGRYVVKFDSAARAGQEANDAKDFAVQTSTDGSTWTDLDTVTGNTEGTVDHTLPAFSARYLRLLLDEPTQSSTPDSTSNPRARVGAFELYAPVANVNLALGATVSATSSDGNFPAARAISGTWGPGYEGWVSEIGKPQAITVDLGSEEPIARYVLKHDGAARPAETANNTRDFTVQLSSNGTDWTTVDTVAGNTESTTDHTIDPVTARYLKVAVTEPVQNTGAPQPRARIAQIELYSTPDAPTPPAPTADFLETQNIDDATVDTDMTIGGAEVAMRTWVASDDNLVVTQLTSKADDEVALTLETWAGAGAPRGGTTTASGVDDGTLWATRSTNPNGNSWTSRAALATRLIGGELTDTSASGPTASGRFVLEPGQSVQIVTGVGGGGQNTTGHLEQAEALTADVDAARVEALDAEHSEWWKQYWLRSHVALGDPALEKYYYSSLYFLGSASREGEQAPGIFGIWATQDNSMWNGDYHLNYNAQAPFYGVYSANRPELALPFTQTILDYVPEAERRAKEDLRRLYPSYVDSRPDLANGIDDAVFFPVGIGPFGSTTDDNYHRQTLDSLFNATQFISYYEYTGDTQYLADTAYPYLVKTANFFEKYLQFDEQTNEYYLWAAHHEGTWSKNSSPDIGLLKYTLAALVDASETLGVDAGKRATWQEILDHLPAAPTSSYNGTTVYSLGEPGTTTIPDGPYGTDTRDIRPGDQPVNLEFIAPGEQIGIRSPADQRQIAIDSLTAMNSWGQDNAFPKVFTIAARVGWPAQDLIDRMDAQIVDKMGPNLRIQSPVHGIEKAGAIEAIDSMLLQSSQGVTTVFANWPTATDASFTRLRAKDAFVVSAALSGGVVGPVSITSDRGNRMSLANPWATANVVVTRADGTPVDSTLTDGVIAFDTSAGTDYLVSLADALTATAAPAISGTPAVGETLSASTGSWNVGGLAFAYRWQRDGADLPGATAASYPLTAADAGGSITVVVTASRAGFADASSTSAAVGPVVAASEPGGDPTPTPTPSADPGSGGGGGSGGSGGGSGGGTSGDGSGSGAGTGEGSSAVPGDGLASTGLAAGGIGALALLLLAGGLALALLRRRAAR